MPPLTPDGGRTPAARLDVVTHNIWVGNKDPRGNLIRLRDDTAAITGTRPHAIVLQEAKRFRGTIPGYDRHACDEHGDECRSTVVLVRDRGVDVTRARFLHVDGPDWVGPKHGDPHEPRTFPDLTLEVHDEHGDQRWDLLGVHRTPGGPNPHIAVNGRSWAAEHDEIVGWADHRQERHEGRPFLIVGDHNDRAGTLEPRSLGRLAADIDATAKMRGIDGALVHGARATAEELPGRYGSDGHQPVIIRARVARR